VTGRGEGVAGVAGVVGDLHQNLVRLDHAEFAAGLVFHHLQAFLEVRDFGRDAGIALPRTLVGLLLTRQVALKFPHLGQAAPAQPQVGLHQQQQDGQGYGDPAHGAFSEPWARARIFPAGRARQVVEAAARCHGPQRRL
jgi:hypothetical protein